MLPLSNAVPPKKRAGGGEELLFLVINLASSAARRLPPAFLFPGSRGTVLGLVLRTAEEENFFPALSPPEADRKFSLPPPFSSSSLKKKRGKERETVELNETSLSPPSP